VRLQTSTQKPCAELASPLPIAIKDFKAWNAPNQRGDVRANPRVTEKFSHHDRRENALAKSQCFLDCGHISAALAGQKSNGGAGVESNHLLSWRSSRKSTENFTLPRILSNPS